MSAVRMVAYGVLEYKHKENRAMFLMDLSEEDREQQRKDDFERDQLRKLVNDELKRYGLLLMREVVPNGTAWRTRANAHTLFGQKTGKPGFMVRAKLFEGDFRECCTVAAGLLDELDAAQVPDTAAGSDQR